MKQKSTNFCCCCQIAQLNSDVESVKIDQLRLEQELDFILGQQRELEDMLVPLEQAMDQLPPISYQQHADVEREHT
jgi:nuclear pore complex protein Nup62